ELGVVEISPIDEDEYKEIAKKPLVQDELSAIDAKLSDINTAIKSLDKYCPEKKGLFKTRRDVTFSEFENVIKNEEQILKTAERIKEAEDRLVWLKAEENKLNNIIMTLIPWVELPMPLDVSGTQKTTVQIGTIPSTVDIDDLLVEITEKTPFFSIDIINSDAELHYINVLVHRESEQECLSVLKSKGFNRVVFPGLTGTVTDNIKGLDKQLSQVFKEKEKTIEDIKEISTERKSLEILYDALSMEKSRIEATSSILETKRIFFISGWVPEELARDVKEKLESKYDVSITITEPAEDEEFPVLLRNKGLAEAGEPVLRMYSLPSSREIDPNAVMTPFFVMFFGLMLGDGGYGIIITLATGFLLWKFKLEESTGKFMKLLFLCGISTIFWGAMFGSWFGISALVEYHIWMDMVSNPELMLSWSFLFGVLHLLAGFALKAANLIRKGKYLDALYDVGFWFIFFIGAILFLLPYAPEVNPDKVVPLVNAGKIMLVVGGILLILTQGRAGKNVIKKFFGGLSSLYDLIGLLSDVLSYSRLLALGLATGIIASIVNQMAVMFDLPGAIKAIAAILILLVGHSINFAINALGAYVHSCRLQYLEFFGKFFEGGGVAFKPLKANTKYITVIPDAIIKDAA
ncbi:MAG: V-type ATP synthase subunit I, partial [Clostridiaceae bacterium]|nr:V-type ATP synthase subunit I [Clostridiaceae bacterium]